MTNEITNHPLATESPFALQTASSDVTVHPVARGDIHTASNTPDWMTVNSLALCSHEPSVSVCSRELDSLPSFDDRSVTSSPAFQQAKTKFDTYEKPDIRASTPVKTNGVALPAILKFALNLIRRLVSFVKEKLGYNHIEKNKETGTEMTSPNTWGKKKRPTPSRPLHTRPKSVKMTPRATISYPNTPPSPLSSRSESGRQTPVTGSTQVTGSAQSRATTVPATLRLAASHLKSTSHSSHRSNSDPAHDGLELVSVVGSSSDHHTERSDSPPQTPLRGVLSPFESGVHPRSPSSNGAFGRCFEDEFTDRPQMPATKPAPEPMSTRSVEQSPSRRPKSSIEMVNLRPVPQQAPVRGPSSPFDGSTVHGQDAVRTYSSSPDEEFRAPPVKPVAKQAPQPRKPKVAPQVRKSVHTEIEMGSLGSNGKTSKPSGQGKGFWSTVRRSRPVRAFSSLFATHEKAPQQVLPMRVASPPSAKSSESTRVASTRSTRRVTPAGRAIGFSTYELKPEPKAAAKPPVRPEVSRVRVNRTSTEQLKHEIGELIESQKSAPIQKIKISNDHRNQLFTLIGEIQKLAVANRKNGKDANHRMRDAFLMEIFRLGKISAGKDTNVSIDSPTGSQISVLGRRIETAVLELGSKKVDFDAALKIYQLGVES